MTLEELEKKAQDTTRLISCVVCSKFTYVNCQERGNACSEAKRIRNKILHTLVSINQLIKEENKGVELIRQERQRQKEVEGFDEHRDSRWYDGELAIAASCYCLIPGRRESRVRDQWALDYEFWKPTPDDRIRELQKAGALIAAEIDRLINLHEKEK